MPEPAPGQSNRQGSGQGSGRPPPQPPPTMPGPATTAWEPPAPRAPRYATAAPGTTYYPPTHLSGSRRLPAGPPPAHQ